MFYLFSLDRLSIINHFKKGIANCSWLSVKKLRLNQELVRLNANKSKVFKAHGFCTKRTYSADNNISRRLSHKVNNSTKNNGAIFRIKNNAKRNKCFIF